MLDCDHIDLGVLCSRACRLFKTIKVFFTYHWSIFPFPFSFIRISHLPYLLFCVPYFLSIFSYASSHIPYPLYLIQYPSSLIPYPLCLILYTLFFIPYPLSRICYPLWFSPYALALIPYPLQLVPQSHTKFKSVSEWISNSMKFQLCELPMQLKNKSFWTGLPPK